MKNNKTSISKKTKIKTIAPKKIVVKNAGSEPSTSAIIIHSASIGFDPKISVIIPVYNVKEFLVECLDSVVSQTLKEIEIICVNDGSTDKSLEILEEYAQIDDRITVLTKKNKGAGIARNEALGVAKGEYIAFMDADDAYPNSMTLQNMYENAILNNVNICGGSLYHFLDNGTIIKDEQLEKGYTFERDGLINYQNYQYDYGFWRFIYKTSFLKNNNLLFPDYLRVEDPSFLVKAMCLSKNFYALKDATYCYRTSHKQIDWCERKVTDAIMGYNDCIVLAKEYNLDLLYNSVLKRVNNEYFLKKVRPHLDKKSVKKALKIISDSEQDNLHHLFYSQCAPKISIIIAVYNVEKYLRQSLNSVINQTLKKIEIICVNDGSTDSSLQILNEYASRDSRIVIINQENQKIGTARNNAMRVARGEYISFVDADDWLRLDACEVLYNKAIKNNLDMLSFSGTNVDDDTNKLIENKYYQFRYLPDDFNIDKFNHKDCTSFLTRMAVSSALTMYRRSFLTENNISFPSNIYFEDNIFFTKAIFSAKFCGIYNEAVYFRRVHKNSVTQNHDKHFKDHLLMVELLIQLLNDLKVSKDIKSIYTAKYINSTVSIFNNFNNFFKDKYYDDLKQIIKKYQINIKLSKGIDKKLTIKNLIKAYLFFPYYFIAKINLRKKIIFFKKGF